MANIRRELSHEERQMFIFQIYNRVNMTMEMLNRMTDDEIERLYMERVVNG